MLQTRRIEGIGARLRAVLCDSIMTTLLQCVLVAGKAGKLADSSSVLVSSAWSAGSHSRFLVVHYFSSTSFHKIKQRTYCAAKDRSEKE